jgi:hypothetical protein
VFGELRIQVTSELSGLGANEGLPVVYSVPFTNLLPLVLPWLAVLALFALKPNRSIHAWWVWLPLGGVYGLAMGLPWLLERLFEFQLGLHASLASCQVFGLAALWLLSACLGGKHRLLAFLGMLISLAAFSALALAQTEWTDWMFDSELFWPVFSYICLMMTCWVLVYALALSLTGWCCRRQFRPVPFLLWLVLWLSLGSLGGAALMAAYSLTHGGEVGGRDFVLGLGIQISVNFLTLCPFLILSFASSFYRERLKRMLNMADATPAPAPIAAAPAAK